MLTYISLYTSIPENYLIIDLNTETVLRFRLDGDITTTVSEDKIEYVGPGIRITVNMQEMRFEVNTESTIFRVSYVDFPEMPEMLAGLIEEYTSKLNTYSSYSGDISDSGESSE